MKSRFFARTATAVAATAIASLGVAATAAQAATASTPQASHSAVKTVKLGAKPRFLCDDFAPAVCVFQQGNFTGTAVPFATSMWRDQWVTLTQQGFMLPWGSFNDDSGSSVVFGDAQTGNKICYPAHSRIPFPTTVIHYRFMWIEFGETNCGGSVPPVP